MSLVRFLVSAPFDYKTRLGDSPERVFCFYPPSLRENHNIIFQDLTLPPHYMADAQRRDLYIEWEISSTATRHRIMAEYEEQYGMEQPQEHWEEYLLEALNLAPSWRGTELEYNKQGRFLVVNGS